MTISWRGLDRWDAVPFSAFTAASACAHLVNSTMAQPLDFWVSWCFSSTQVLMGPYWLKWENTSSREHSKRRPPAGEAVRASKAAGRRGRWSAAACLRRSPTNSLGSAHTGSAAAGDAMPLGCELCLAESQQIARVKRAGRYHWPRQLTVLLRARQIDRAGRGLPATWPGVAAQRAAGAPVCCSMRCERPNCNPSAWHNTAWLLCMHNSCMHSVCTTCRHARPRDSVAQAAVCCHAWCWRRRRLWERMWVRGAHMHAGMQPTGGSRAGCSAHKRLALQHTDN